MLNKFNQKLSKDQMILDSLGHFTQWKPAIVVEISKFFLKNNCIQNPKFFFRYSIQVVLDFFFNNLGAATFTFTTGGKKPNALLLLPKHIYPLSKF